MVVSTTFLVVHGPMIVPCTPLLVVTWLPVKSHRSLSVFGRLAKGPTFTKNPVVVYGELWIFRRTVWAVPCVVSAALK